MSLFAFTSHTGENEDAGVIQFKTSRIEYNYDIFTKYFTVELIIIIYYASLVFVFICLQKKPQPIDLMGL